MSGWNRLFVVVAVLWAIAAPFVLMADTNTPVDKLSNAALTLPIETMARATHGFVWTWTRIGRR
jgi:hypothetical protein